MHAFESDPLGEMKKFAEPPGGGVVHAEVESLMSAAVRDDSLPAASMAVTLISYCVPQAPGGRGWWS